MSIDESDIAAELGAARAFRADRTQQQQSEATISGLVSLPASAFLNGDESKS